MNNSWTALQTPTSDSKGHSPTVRHGLEGTAVYLGELPQLPVREHFNLHGASENGIPDAMLDAVGYREFLAEALTHGDIAIAAFREALNEDNR